MQIEKQQFEILSAADADINTKMQNLTQYKGILTTDTKTKSVGVTGYANGFGGSIVERVMASEALFVPGGVMDVEWYVSEVLRTCVSYDWIYQNQSGKTLVVKGEKDTSITVKCIS